MSSLHRHMVNQFTPLALATQMTQHKPISRAQLPIVLAKINGTRFARLIFDWFGLQLDAHQKKWFAIDRESSTFVRNVPSRPVEADNQLVTRLGKETVHFLYPLSTR